MATFPARRPSPDRRASRSPRCLSSRLCRKFWQPSAPCGSLYPDADAVIELGGEDAKVMYLSGNPEQRMNATCAGGTGGFIDTIAFMLGVRSSDMSRLAGGASRIYPIASRCAVFAQTDVRPLLNAGAKKSDIAASVLEAVVRQTITGGRMRTAHRGEGHFPWRTAPIHSRPGQAFPDWPWVETRRGH